MDDRRRDLLATCGVAVATGLAGCPSISGGGGDDDDNGGSDGDGGGSTTPTYADWLGPEMADAQYLLYNDDDIDIVDGVVAHAPAAGFETQLSEEITSSWREMFSGRDIGVITVDFDPAAMRLQLVDFQQTFSVFRGGFDATAVRSDLKENATRQGSHRGRDIYVGERMYDEGGRRIPQGIGVGDDTIVVAYGAPTTDRAAAFVRSILDTAAGAADRFTDTDDRFAEVQRRLDPGVYVSYDQVGSRRPGGLTLTVDGAEATRRQVLHSGDKSADTAVDAIRTRVEDRSVIVTDEGTPYTEPFLDRYTDYEVRPSGDCAVFEGRLPADEVARGDLRT